MALPGSGTISIAQIRDEFGGGNPASLSQYYRGVGNVRNFGAGGGFINGSIPTSGQVSMSQFHGAARLLAFNPQSVFSTSIQFDPAGAQIFIFPEGGAITRATQGFSVQTDISIGPWYAGPNSGGTFDVRATLVSGNTPFGDALNVWHNCASQREWGLFTTGFGFEQLATTFDLQFRLAAQPSRLSNLIRINLSATTEI
jgi:hypothetical protein